MKPIYVVMASTGEYSDRSEWPLRAYTDYTVAQTFLTECDKWAMENKVGSGCTLDDYYGQNKKIHLLDDPFRIFDQGHLDYTGVSFSIMGVNLYE